MCAYESGSADVSRSLTINVDSMIRGEFLGSYREGDYREKVGTPQSHARQRNSGESST
jgi:hypothetical protein